MHQRVSTSTALSLLNQPGWQSAVIGTAALRAAILGKDGRKSANEDTHSIENADSQLKEQQSSQVNETPMSSKRHGLRGKQTMNDSSSSRLSVSASQPAIGSSRETRLKMSVDTNTISKAAAAAIDMDSRRYDSSNPAGGGGGVGKGGVRAASAAVATVTSGLGGKTRVGWRPTSPRPGAQSQAEVVQELCRTGSLRTLCWNMLHRRFDLRIGASKVNVYRHSLPVASLSSYFCISNHGWMFARILSTLAFCVYLPAASSSVCSGFT